METLGHIRCFSKGDVITRPRLVWRSSFSGILLLVPLRASLPTRLLLSSQILDKRYQMLVFNALAPRPLHHDLSIVMR